MAEGYGPNKKLRFNHKIIENFCPTPSYHANMAPVEQHWLPSARSVRCKICKDKTDRTEERDKSTIIVTDLNTLLSTVARTTRKKISKDVEELNNTINLINMYRTSHPTTAEYPFFSSVYRPIPR